MDENEVNSNDLFYGAGAGTSGNEISDADMALLEKSNSQGVEVRDGDDLIEIPTGEQEEEAEETDEDQEDTPEDEEQKPEVPKNEDPEVAPLVARIEESNKDLEALGDDLIAKGVDVASMLAEYQETGKLSDKSYEALEKAGWSRGAMNLVIRGNAALEAEAGQTLANSVGGMENLNALSKFAVANDPSAVEAYNEAFGRGDVRTCMVILRGIQASHKAAYGTANKQISGRPAAPKQAPQKAGFATKSDMTKAINDGRYGKDLAYTADVERKIANSNW